LYDHEVDDDVDDDYDDDNNNNNGKEVKIQEFMYRDRANVEPEMYDCTSNN